MSHIERKTFYSAAECGGDCDAMYARVNVVTKLRMNAEISKNSSENQILNSVWFTNYAKQ